MDIIFMIILVVIITMLFIIVGIERELEMLKTSVDHLLYRIEEKESGEE